MANKNMIIRVGICAMEEKLNTTAMRLMADTLRTYRDLEIIVFNNETILNQNEEDWPIVDAFLCFYSIGFPLEKDDAKDVKVYSAPNLSYAELRKSPSVDGHVERSSSGKEKRTVTKLNDEESSLSLRINKAFRQFICGFDILRTNGKSYVCDVNGWSCVKGFNRIGFYEETCGYLHSVLLGQFSSHNMEIETLPDSANSSPLAPSPSLTSSSNNIFTYINTQQYTQEE
eukprot:gene20699-24858_t